MDVLIDRGYRAEDILAVVDVEGLIRFAVEAEDKHVGTEVSISFVDNERMQELNREYRGIDRPTDVLSFECDNLDDGFNIPGFEENIYELGDIVIAPDVAQAQAPTFGMSFADEVSLLLVHGVLHLCGYDHMDDEQAELMEAREMRILSDYYQRPFKREAI